MIDTLRQVIEQVEQLDTDKQSIVAGRFQQVLEELEAQEWRELFHSPRSAPALERLIEQALAEDDAGETEEGGWAL